jgi:hypothetical protein
MTDPKNCGECEEACQSVGETCTAGHCVDTIETCATIHQVNPASDTGFYTLTDGTQIYCEMTHSELTYEQLGIGEFDHTFAGYSQISFTEFADPLMQATFIALFNHQGGAKAIEVFSVGNCCMKADNSANMLGFGAGATNIIFPATPPSTVVCGGYVVGTAYSVALQGSGMMIQSLPLPAAFFTTHPPQPVSNCGTAMNPSFFWKRHP